LDSVEDTVKMAFCVQANGLRHSSDSHFEQLGLLLWINNVVDTPTAMNRGED
jgi:hypothetical protein